MITREAIINALAEKGIKAEPTEIIKNNVTLQGITLGTGCIRPTIYTEWYTNYTEDELEDAIDEIIYKYNKAMNEAPVINPNLMDWDYVKNHLQLCIQQKGNEDIVKRDFLDLEEYVRVIVETDLETTGSFKVTPKHLEKFGVTEEALFHAAWDCTAPTIEIEDMAQILDMSESLMIVASNESKLHGAIAIKATEKLAEVADRYEKDLIILPSSIHEILLLPLIENIDFSGVNKMIQDINTYQLEPEEILSNHAYRFNRNTREITML